MTRAELLAEYDAALRRSTLPTETTDRMRRVAEACDTDTLRRIVEDCRATPTGERPMSKPRRVQPGNQASEPGGDDAPFTLAQPRPAFRPFEAGIQSGTQPKLFTGSHSDLAGQASLFDADSVV